MYETAVAATVPSLAEAQIIVGLLGSEGIDAIISSDDAGGTEPQFQLTAGVRVVVRAADADRARSILAEARSSDD